MSEGDPAPPTTPSRAPAPRTVGRSRVTGGPWVASVGRLRRNRVALAGGGVLALMMSLALLAPVMAPRDPIKIDAEGTLRPPSAQRLFGSDHLGRDVFSRALYGGRLSLRVGLVSVGISLGCGLGL